MQQDLQETKEFQNYISETADGQILIWPFIY